MKLLIKKEQSVNLEMRSVGGTSCQRFVRNTVQDGRHECSTK